MKRTENITKKPTATAGKKVSGKSQFTRVARAVTLLAFFSMSSALVALDAPNKFTVAVAGADIHIGFGTVTGQAYTLEKSTTLAQGSWTQLLSNVAGTGAVQTTTDAGAGTRPKCFYRILYGVTTTPNNVMVVVAGGTLPVSSTLGPVAVSAFSIGKYETTWGDWKTVRTWAGAHGYDIGSVGAGSADTHPVQAVSWCDVVKWCNARSEMEGLTPVYTVGGATYKTTNAVPVVNASANGYRLPTEAEWEWAARGGTLTHGYTYSGSNTIGDVAWYDGNSSGAAVDMSSGKGTWPVGQKAANELGLYDMSGNVNEWCWDSKFSGRIVRGGSYRTLAVGCAVSFLDYYNPVTKVDYIGFRPTRSSGN